MTKSVAVFSLVVLGVVTTLVYHNLTPSETTNVTVINEVTEEWTEHNSIPETPEIEVVYTEEEDIYPTFSEAYASARETLGTDGTFEWNGSTYHTRTVEEDSVYLHDINNSVDSVKIGNRTIQIVESFLPVEEVEDSTIIYNEMLKSLNSTNEK